jgi:hypothetical protein
MRLTSLAAAALMLALAAPAVSPAISPAMAQAGPPPAPPKQSGPAAVWNDQVWQTNAPVFSADLGVGGVGGFTGVLDPATNQLCYMLSAPGVEAATAARIVAADAAPKAKAALVLKVPAGGASGACVALKADLATAMRANPAGYAVEVDNKAYAGGAVKGTLSAWDGVTKVAG